MNIDKQELCDQIMREEPGALYAHAVCELPPADGDEMQELMNKSLLQMVLVFSSQGHSGFSAAYAVNALAKLLKFEPLGPLTGEDSEWNEVGEGMWQNNRCSHVFKDATGAYDIDGRIFREANGSCYTNRESRVPVVFPYTPVSEYVDVQPDLDG